MAVVPAPSGKDAITEYEVTHFDNESKHWSWINCHILTGRTHQIRVHLKECLNCPILGDTIYAQPKKQKTKVPRLMLHAHTLKIEHPEKKEEVLFQAPLPRPFKPFQV